MFGNTISGHIMKLLSILHILPRGTNKVVDAAGFAFWLLLITACALFSLIYNESFKELRGESSIAEVYQQVCWKMIPRLELVLQIPLLFYNGRLNMALIIDYKVVNPGRHWVLVVSVFLKITSFALDLAGKNMYSFGHLYVSTDVLDL